MRIIGFLRSIFGSSEDSSNEVSEEVKGISFSNLEKDFYSESEKLSEEEAKFAKKVKENVLEIKKEALEKLSALESVDVGSKNVQDRAKKVVKENLDNYIDLYKELFSKLGKIKAESLSGFLKEADRVMKDFENKSYTNYQKASFLFEKKIKDANQKVVEVSKYLQQVSRDYSDLLKRSKTFSSIEDNFGQINDLRNRLSISSSNIKNIDSKINEREREKGNIERNIEKIKNSGAYLRNLEKSKQVTKETKDLDKDLKELKDSIDFKELGHAFHEDKKKMEVVKNYKDNFFIKFKEDKGESLKGLLGSLGKEDLVSKLDELAEKSDKIEKLESSFEDSGIEDLKSKIKRIDSEIDGLREDREKEEKNYNKISERIYQLKKKSSNLLKEVGFEVRD